MDKIPPGLAIAIIDRAFKKKMDAKAAVMGLTAAQLRVLAEISLLQSRSCEEINQRDIEKSQQVTHPTMTGIISRLESKGFIFCCQSDKDKRYKKIVCADKYKDIHKELLIEDNAVLAEICRDLTQEEVQKYLEITEKILKNIL